MNFELSPIGILIAASWGLCVPVATLPQVVVAFLVFCSKSIPISILLLLLLQLIAFFNANMGTQRESSGTTQRRFVMVLVGGFLSVFGAALGAARAGHVLVFLGLLVMIPNGVTTFFFSRFYERLTLKAFVGSCLIPAFVAINILLKFRAEVRSEDAALWDFGVMGLGALTLIYSSALAFLRLRIKRVLIYWAQAWTGVALFLLAAESDQFSEVSFAALAVFSLSSVILLSLASQSGQRFYAFARIASLGMPGLISFAAIFFTMKMAWAMGGIGLGIIFAGYLLLAMTLISCGPGAGESNYRGVRVKFWIVTAVQALSGCGLFWMSSGVLK